MRTKSGLTSPAGVLKYGSNILPKYSGNKDDMLFSISV
jgi:hypothetical protein